uniref:Uncharacterized protein n=1 Tax=Physcomitrium patens TaxID=3218 RepID=A0A2K1J111_PHYPA|nr:hypothetical protein PHYPA_023117 [Physcomitrium patens]
MHSSERKTRILTLYLATNVEKKVWNKWMKTGGFEMEMKKGREQWLKTSQVGSVEGKEVYEACQEFIVGAR